MFEEILVGRHVINFEIMEHGFCTLELNDSCAISIETLCRYVGCNKEFFSSQDHGQLFGLDSPFDVSSEITNAIKDKIIQNVSFSKTTGDLTLHFESGSFEIICTSSGYECYQINAAGHLLMVVRGGSQIT